MGQLPLVDRLRPVGRPGSGACSKIPADGAARALNGRRSSSIVNHSQEGRASPATEEVEQVGEGFHHRAEVCRAEVGPRVVVHVLVDGPLLHLGPTDDLGGDALQLAKLIDHLLL